MRHPTLQMMDCALIGQSGWIAIVASYFVYILPLLLVGLMQDFDTAKRVAKPKVCSLCGSTPATEGVTWHRIGALHTARRFDGATFQYRGEWFGSTDLRCGQIPRAMLQIYAKQHVSQYKIPLWKLLHQTLYNHWLRRLAHGREVYVV